jgi:hypothetical protein
MQVIHRATHLGHLIGKYKNLTLHSCGEQLQSQSSCYGDQALSLIVVSLFPHHPPNHASMPKKHHHISLGLVLK